MNSLRPKLGAPRKQIIRTAQLPDSVQAGHCLAALDDEPTIVSTVAFPLRKRDWGLWVAGLEASGVDPAHLSLKQDGEAARTLLAIRMQARHVTQLVVFEAGNLPPRMLDALADFCCETKVDLNLIFGDGSGAHVTDFAKAAGGELLDWAGIVAAIPQLPLANSDPRVYANEDEPCAFPDEIPWVDFPLFRAMSRSLLPSEQFETLDRTYTSVYRECRTSAPDGMDEMVQFLRKQFAHARNGAEVITMARAAQAASLINGQLLLVDPFRIFDQAEKGRYRRLNTYDLTQLWTLGETWQAAAIVLHDAEVDAESMESLTIGDIEGNWTSPMPLAPGTSVFLLSHLAHRMHYGATASDPFITQPKRAIDELLTYVTNELGIPVDPSTGRDRRKSDRWRHVNGIDLRELT